MANPKRTIYELQGTLLEACSCGVLCPCWVGEDPDGGECFAANAYHFDQGVIDGIDVSGLNLVNVVHIPGNVLAPASWRVVMVVDDRADDRQRDAMVGVYSGKYGGPLADLAGLIGELVAVESRPIVHEVTGGKGTLRIADVVTAEMEPFRSPDGTISTLRDSLFSTVPGSPAYVSKASTFKVNLPQHGMKWEFDGRNAIQSDYRIAYQA